MEKIRSYTYTVAFEKAISKLTLGAISSVVKAKFVMAVVVGGVSSISSIIKSTYEKPDLKGKKEFYAKNIVYGYTYQSGREAVKRIGVDAKKRTMKGTVTYSDPAIKGK